MDKIISLSSQHEPTIMSAAQELINKGEQEGWQKGKREGKQEGLREGALTIAKSMLQAREPEEKIIRFTGLTLQQLSQLSN